MYLARWNLGSTQESNLVHFFDSSPPIPLTQVSWLQPHQNTCIHRIFTIILPMWDFFFFNFTILEVTLQQISKCFIRVFFFTVSPQNKIFLNRYQFFDNMWHLLMVLIFTFCVFMRLYQFLHIYCQFVFLWKIVHFFYF